MSNIEHRILNDEGNFAIRHSLFAILRFKRDLYLCERFSSVKKNGIDKELNFKRG